MLYYVLGGKTFDAVIEFGWDTMHDKTKYLHMYSEKCCLNFSY